MRLGPDQVEVTIAVEVGRRRRLAPRRGGLGPDDHPSARQVQRNLEVGPAERGDVVTAVVIEVARDHHAESEGSHRGIGARARNRETAGAIAERGQEPAFPRHVNECIGERVAVEIGDHRGWKDVGVGHRRNRCHHARRAGSRVRGIHAREERGRVRREQEVDLPVPVEVGEGERPVVRARRSRQRPTSSRGDAGPPASRAPGGPRGRRRSSSTGRL